LTLSEENGIELIYIPHSPLTTDPAYHRELLSCLKKGHGKLSCGFFFEDVPVLSEWEVLKGYLEVFHPRKSVIRVYLADYERHVRQRNGFEAVLHTVAEFHEFCFNRCVVLQTAVLVGLPGQNRESAEKTAAWLVKFLPELCMPLIYTAEMHPGSERHRAGRRLLQVQRLLVHEGSLPSDVLVRDEIQQTRTGVPEQYCGGKYL